MTENPAQHNIYGLYTGEATNPTFFYVGVTKRSIEARFKEHQRGVKSDSKKSAYEFARYYDTFNIMLLDVGTEFGLTEFDYIEMLKKDGHPIQNSTTGNTTIQVKKPKCQFAIINKLAKKKLLHIEVLNTLQVLSPDTLD